MSIDASVSSLIVEGPDDGVVVNALVRRRLGHDLARKDQRIVKSAEGITNAIDLFKKAAARVQPNGRVGLLVDRDGLDNKPDRWIEVRAALAQLEFSPPELPPSQGWSMAGPNAGSKVGVWLMPDNVQPGDLEHFLESLLPQDRKLWDFAGAATTDARRHAATYREKDLRKAHVHAWLSWLDAPGGGYGIAIERRDLHDTSPAANAFLAWFQRLFLDA